MKYLLKTTDTYRVDTLEEVERLRDEEYYVVTVKKNITAENMPDRQVKVTYEVDV